MAGFSDAIVASIQLVAVDDATPVLQRAEGEVQSYAAQTVADLQKVQAAYVQTAAVASDSLGKIRQAQALSTKSSGALTAGSTETQSLQTINRLMSDRAAMTSNAAKAMAVLNTITTSDTAAQVQHFQRLQNLLSNMNKLSSVGRAVYSGGVGSPTSDPLTAEQQRRMSDLISQTDQLAAKRKAAAQSAQSEIATEKSLSSLYSEKLGLLREQQKIEDAMKLTERGRLAATGGVGGSIKNGLTGQMPDLKALKEYSQQLEQLNKKAGDVAREFEKNASQLARGEAFQQLTGQLAQEASAVATAQAKLASDIESANARIKKSDDEVSANRKKRFEEMRTAASGAGIGGIVVGAVSAAAAGLAGWQAMSFENQITHSEAFAGMTPQQAAGNERYILGHAGPLGLSPTSMGAGLYDIYSSGVTGPVAQTILGEGGKAAAASQTPLAQLTDVGTTVANAYGITDPQKMKLAMEQMNEAVLVGKMQWQDFGTAVGESIPEARLMKVNIGMLSALIARLTNQGVSTQQSSQDVSDLLRKFSAPTPRMIREAQTLGLNYNTAFNPDYKNQGVWGMLENINKVTDAQSVLRDAGKAPAQLAAEQHITMAQAEKEHLTLQNKNIALTNLFGGDSVALRTFLELMSNGSDKATKAMIDHVTHATDSIEKSFNMASTSSLFKFHQALAGIEVALVRVGTTFLPEINDILSGLTRASDFISTFAQKNSEATKKIIEVGLAIGGIGVALKVLELASRPFKAIIDLVDTLYNKLKQSITTAGLDQQGKYLQAYGKSYEEAQKQLGTLQRMMSDNRPFTEVQRQADITTGAFDRLDKAVRQVRTDMSALQMPTLLETGASKTTESEATHAINKVDQSVQDMANRVAPKTPTAVSDPVARESTAQAGVKAQQETASHAKAMSGLLQSLPQTLGSVLGHLPGLGFTSKPTTAGWGFQPIQTGKYDTVSQIPAGLPNDAAIAAGMHEVDIWKGKIEAESTQVKRLQEEASRADRAFSMAGLAGDSAGADAAIEARAKAIDGLALAEERLGRANQNFGTAKEQVRPLLSSQEQAALDKNAPQVPTGYRLSPQEQGAAKTSVAGRFLRAGGEFLLPTAAGAGVGAYFGGTEGALTGGAIGAMLPMLGINPVVSGALSVAALGGVGIAEYLKQLTPVKTGQHVIADNPNSPFAVAAPSWLQKSPFAGLLAPNESHLVQQQNDALRQRYISNITGKNNSLDYYGMTPSQVQSFAQKDFAIREGQAGKDKASQAALNQNIGVFKAMAAQAKETGDRAGQDFYDALVRAADKAKATVTQTGHQAAQKAVDNLIKTTTGATIGENHQKQVEAAGQALLAADQRALVRAEDLIKTAKGSTEAVLKKYDKSISDLTNQIAFIKSHKSTPTQYALDHPEMQLPAKGKDPVSSLGFMAGPADKKGMELAQPARGPGNEVLALGANTKALEANTAHLRELDAAINKHGQLAVTNAPKHARDPKHFPLDTKPTQASFLGSTSKGLGGALSSAFNASSSIPMTSAWELEGYKYLFDHKGAIASGAGAMAKDLAKNAGNELEKSLQGSLGHAIQSVKLTGLVGLGGAPLAIPTTVDHQDLKKKVDEASTKVKESAKPVEVKADQAKISKSVQDALDKVRVTLDLGKGTKITGTIKDIDKAIQKALSDGLKTLKIDLSKDIKVSGSIKGIDSAIERDLASAKGKLVLDLSKDIRVSGSIKNIDSAIERDLAAAKGRLVLDLSRDLKVSGSVRGIDSAIQQQLASAKGKLTLDLSKDVKITGKLPTPKIDLTGLEREYATLGPVVQKVLQQLTTAQATWAQQAASAFQTDGQKLLASLGTGMQAGEAAVKAIVTQLLTSIGQAFAAADGQAQGWGQKLLASLADGIKGSQVQNALLKAVQEGMKQADAYVKAHPLQISAMMGMTGMGGTVGGGAAGLGALFGVAGGSFTNSGVESGNVNMYRRLGIGYQGSLQDWDYGSPQGTPISLPGGKGIDYTYLRSLTENGPQGHMGTAMFFRTPGEGVMQFNHLSNTANLQPGQTVAGGTQVGLSGYSSGIYGNGAHLCLVTDAKGRQFLMMLSGADLAGAAQGLGSVPSAIGQWSSQIRAAASATGLSPALIAAQMQEESGGNAGARSSAGAIGLMQLMPGTASGLGVNPYNPAQNVMGGAKYLASILHGPARGNLKLALQMYNAGPGDPGAADPSYAPTIMRLMQQYGVGGGFGDQTLQDGGGYAGDTRPGPVRPVYYNLPGRGYLPPQHSYYNLPGSGSLPQQHSYYNLPGSGFLSQAPSFDSTGGQFSLVNSLANQSPKAFAYSGFGQMMGDWRQMGVAGGHPLAYPDGKTITSIPDLIGQLKTLPPEVAAKFKTEAVGFAEQWRKIGNDYNRAATTENTRHEQALSTIGSNSSFRQGQDLKRYGIADTQRNLLEIDRIQQLSHMPVHAQSYYVKGHKLTGVDWFQQRKDLIKREEQAGIYSDTYGNVDPRKVQRALALAQAEAPLHGQTIKTVKGHTVHVVTAAEAEKENRQQAIKDLKRRFEITEEGAGAVLTLKIHQDAHNASNAVDKEDARHQAAMDKLKRGAETSMTGLRDAVQAFEQNLKSTLDPAKLWGTWQAHYNNQLGRNLNTVALGMYSGSGNAAMYDTAAAKYQKAYEQTELMSQAMGRAQLKIGSLIGSFDLMKSGLDSLITYNQAQAYKAQRQGNAGSEDQYLAQMNRRIQQEAVLQKQQDQLTLRAGQLSGSFSQLQQGLQGLQGYYSQRAFANAYNGNIEAEQRAIDQMNKYTLSLQKLQAMSDRVNANAAYQRGDLGSYAAGLDSTIQLIRGQLEKKYLGTGVLDPKLLAQMNAYVDSQVRATTVNDEFAAKIALASGDLGAFSTALGSTITYFESQVTQALLGGGDARTPASKAYALKQAQAATQTFQAGQDTLEGIVGGNYNTIVTGLSTLSTYATTEMLDSLVQGKPVTDQLWASFDALKAATDDARLAQEGLTGLQAVRGGSLPEMSSAASTLMGEAVTKWTQGGSIAGVLTANSAVTHLGNAQSLQDTLLGQATGNAAGMSQGLTGLLNTKLNGIAYNTAMMGRTGDPSLIPDVAQLGTEALAAANNLTSFSEIVSGVGQVMGSLRENMDTQFARTGTLSQGSIDQYRAAGNEAWKLQADQIQSHLLQDRGYDVNAYLQDLSDAESYMQGQLNTMTANGQQGTDKYTKLAAALTQTQNESAAGGLYLQSLQPNATPLTVTQQGAVGSFLTNWKNGTSGADAGLALFTGQVTTSGDLQKQYNSELAAGKDGLTQIATAATAAATNLTKIGPTVLSILQGLQSLFKGATAITINATNVTINAKTIGGAGGAGSTAGSTSTPAGVAARQGLHAPDGSLPGSGSKTVPTAGQILTQTAPGAARTMAIGDQVLRDIVSTLQTTDRTFTLATSTMTSGGLTITGHLNTSVQTVTTALNGGFATLGGTITTGITGLTSTLTSGFSQATGAAQTAAGTITAAVTQLMASITAAIAAGKSASLNIPAQFLGGSSTGGVPLPANGMSPHPPVDSSWIFGGNTTNGAYTPVGTVTGNGAYTQTPTVVTSGNGIVDNGGPAAAGVNWPDASQGGALQAAMGGGSTGSAPAATDTSAPAAPASSGPSIDLASLGYFLNTAQTMFNAAHMFAGGTFAGGSTFYKGLGLPDVVTNMLTAGTQGVMDSAHFEGAGEYYSRQATEMVNQAIQSQGSQVATQVQAGMTPPVQQFTSAVQQFAGAVSGQQVPPGWTVGGGGVLYPDPSRFGSQLPAPIQQAAALAPALNTISRIAQEPGSLASQLLAGTSFGGQTAANPLAGRPGYFMGSDGQLHPDPSKLGFLGHADENAFLANIMPNGGTLNGMYVSPEFVKMNPLFSLGQLRAQSDSMAQMMANPAAYHPFGTYEQTPTGGMMDVGGFGYYQDQYGRPIIPSSYMNGQGIYGSAGSFMNPISAAQASQYLPQYLTKMGDQYYLNDPNAFMSYKAGADQASQANRMNTLYPSLGTWDNGQWTANPAAAGGFSDQQWQSIYGQMSAADLAKYGYVAPGFHIWNFTAASPDQDYGTTFNAAHYHPGLTINGQQFPGYYDQLPSGATQYTSNDYGNYVGAGWGNGTQPPSVIALGAMPNQNYGSSAASSAYILSQLQAPPRPEGPSNARNFPGSGLPGNYSYGGGSSYGGGYSTAANYGGQYLPTLGPNEYQSNVGSGTLGGYTGLWAQLFNWVVNPTGSFMGNTNLSAVQTQQMLASLQQIATNTGQTSTNTKQIVDDTTQLQIIDWLRQIYNAWRTVNTGVTPASKASDFARWVNALGIKGVGMLAQ